MERLFASDTWYKLLKLLFKPVFFWAMATVATHTIVAVNKFFMYRIKLISVINMVEGNKIVDTNQYCYNNNLWKETR